MSLVSLIPFADFDLALAPEPPEFEAFARKELADAEAEESELELDAQAAGVALAEATAELDGGAMVLTELRAARAGDDIAGLVEQTAAEVAPEVEGGDAVLALIDAELGVIEPPIDPPPPPPPPPPPGGGFGGGGGAVCEERGSPEWPCTF